VPVVYVANGLNWPDALSAGPAAAFLGGPLLLVSPDRLPADVAAELSRLRPRRIVVVGGNASVSDAVFSEIAKLAPIVDRVGGSDRYETSRAVIRDAFGSHIESRALFVATGRNFPDALSAGYGAGKLKAPVLLVDGIQTGLDQATHDLLSNTIFGTVEIIGGPAAVSPGLALDLTHVTKWEYVSREGGVDRYDTNRIANNAYGGYTPHSGFAFVASGTGFADALAAVPVAVKESAPLFLAPPGCMPGETLAEMHHLHAHDITILGGPQALSAAVEGLVTC